MVRMTKSVTDSQEVAETQPGSGPIPVDKPVPTLIKRQEVADILGVTVSEVRRLERTGGIRPTRRNPQGVWLFDSVEIRRIADTRKPTSLTRKSADPYTPDEAGIVFIALNAGKTLVECVLECKLMPRTVEIIAADYARLSGGMYLRKETMDVINGLALEGTFPLKGEPDLLDVLKAASADTCKGCDTRARVFCKPCALKLSQKVSRDPIA